MNRINESERFFIRPKGNVFSLIEIHFQSYLNIQTTLKCKPFTVLSEVPSQSSLNVSPARQSTRISTGSRANKNETAEGQRIRCSGERKQKSKNRVQCLSEDDDEDFVVQKKRSPRKRRSNQIQCSEDDEDNFVSLKTKSPKSNKMRSRKNDEDDEDDVEPKRKTPLKRERRKLRLTIKCNKITDYYPKVTNPTTNQGKF